MSESAASPTSTETKEFWTYAGKRVSSKGKPCNSWIDSTNHEYYFGGKINYHTLGGVYEIVTLRDGDKISLKGIPNYIKPGERNPEWIALDAEADSRIIGDQEEKRRAKKGKPIGTLTLEQIRREMVKLPICHQAGLLVSVLRYLRVGVL